MAARSFELTSRLGFGVVARCGSQILEERLGFALGHGGEMTGKPCCPRPPLTAAANLVVVLNGLGRHPVSRSYVNPAVAIPNFLEVAAAVLRPVPVHGV